MSSSPLIYGYADLLRYFDATDLKTAERTLREQMSCDAWLNVGVDKMSVSALANGDALESDPLTFPFTESDLEHTIAWVDDRATELHNEIMDADEEETISK